MDKKRNLDRFVGATGRSETQYYRWAKEVGRRGYINNADRLVCEKLGLYTVAHLDNMPTPHLNETWADRQEYLIQHSHNPLELGMIWAGCNREAECCMQVESVLARHLRSFPKEDFLRWGDKNRITASARRWFGTGTHLDQQADELLETQGVNVKIQDIIDFVESYKPGEYRNEMAQTRDRVADVVKALFGFQLTDYYVEHLQKMNTYRLYFQEQDELPF